MTRQVAFACNIARPQARDTPRSGHPAPTSLPCQPRRFDLPVLRQANHLQGQHSVREQERAETARQGTLTVTFTARKSPVQATPPTRQPIHQPQHLPFFQSSFHLRPTVGFSGSGGAGKTPSPTKTFAGSRRIPTSGEAAVRCKRCWALTPAGARHPCPLALFSRLARCG